LKCLLLSALLFLVGCTSALTATPQALTAESETVLLLHGYGRTPWSMWPLERRLRAAGFAVENIGYPSIRQSPSELVTYLHRQVEDCCQRSSRIHFVTHSLGGILVRAYLVRYPPPNLGRVVMLAPPNQGSELADIASRSAWLRWMLGPTVVQLGTGPDSLPNRLPAPWYDVGVIAGVDTFNPIGDFFVAQPSDGTVSVASTRLEAMRDFVTVKKSHTFIMHSADVADYIIRFLKTGSFAVTSPDSP
jgi:triacylglycerol lipase